MTLLQVICTVVFTFHNFSDSYCLAIPVIWTAKNSLTTEKTSPVEIVTPIPQSNVVYKKKKVPTKMFPFPSEMIHFKTEMSHFPIEISTLPTEISTFPKKENKTIPKSFENNHRIPKFFGRLAFLAGLGLAGLANTASSINVGSKDPQSPITLNLSSTKLRPYFAAVYEPFSSFPQPYFYSNLFELVPFYNGMNSQNLQPAADNFHNSQHQSILTQSDDTQPDEIDHEVMNEEFHEEYVVENRKADNNTVEGRINVEEVMEEKKTNPITGTNLEENMSLHATEEEPERNEELEKLNFKLLSPAAEQQPPKLNKPHILHKQAEQNNPTTKKPIITQMTTVRVKPTNVTNLNNSTQTNSTNSGEITQPNIQNTTTSYPYFQEYYGGNPHNIHELYITTSENTPRHENYNEISPHYSEDWLNNRIPIEPNYFDVFSHPNYEVQSPVVEEPTLIDDTNFFKTASPPEFINSGFRPSFQF